MLVVEGKGGGDHSVSMWGDAVGALVWHLGDQAVSARLGDET
jgi:hypothetical protein